MAFKGRCADLSHYYTKDNDLLESRPREIFFTIAGKNYRFLTDRGVFSRSGLDFGTRLLLETIIPVASGRILDLGCGYGPIGIVLSEEGKNDVIMVDVNPRAIELARLNARSNKVKPRIIHSDGFAVVDGNFDMIVTNPPVRAGKKVYYDWFAAARTHLEPNGELVFVLRKDQGAASAISHCRQLYALVDILARKSGYFVIKCKNYLTI